LRLYHARLPTSIAQRRLDQLAVKKGFGDRGRLQVLRRACTHKITDFLSAFAIMRIESGSSEPLPYWSTMSSALASPPFLMFSSPLAGFHPSLSS